MSSFPQDGEDSEKRGAMHARAFAFAAIAMAVITFYIFVRPSDVADYDSYLYLIDQTYYFFQLRDFLFEPGSAIFLYLARIWAGNAVGGVDLAHYMLSALFLLFSALIARRPDVSPLGLIAFFAFYGPLMAFVTVRATPAYFLIAWAALEANQGRLRSLALAACALLFHVSAAFAIPPLCVALFQNRFSSMHWLERSTVGFLIVAGFFAMIFYYFKDQVSDLIVAAVQSIPFLSKYTVYISGIEYSGVPEAVVQSASSQLYHYIYSVIVSVFVLVFFLQSDDSCKKFRAYIISSYMIFMFLQFSPVSAFRQSPFWVMPGLFLFPWSKFSFRGIGSILMIALCCGIFATQVASVIP